MNYIARGLVDLKYAIIIGMAIYTIFFLPMYVLKRRKGTLKRCVPEMILCIYGVLLIRLAGVFSLHFNFDWILSYSLTPFIGSSFILVLSNFVPFVPYGLLLHINGIGKSRFTSFWY